MRTLIRPVRIPLCGQNSGRLRLSMSMEPAADQVNNVDVVVQVRASSCLTAIPGARWIEVARTCVYGARGTVMFGLVVTVPIDADRIRVIGSGARRGTEFEMMYMEALE